MAQDISIGQLAETLNDKADIDLNNTNIFMTSGNGQVKLVNPPDISSNSEDVSSTKYVTSYNRELITKNLLNYTTNRILEIPQDIKCEISDNRLVIKAGSKIWYPDGFDADGITPKFSFVTIANDIISGKYGAGRSCFVVYSFNDEHPIEWSSARSFFSRETQPEANWYIWYDTSANRIKLHNKTDGYDTNVTFPICAITENPESASGLHDGGVKSVDQIYNGFGYISSTLFALPGVKCLAANGIDNIGRALSNNYIINDVLIRTIAKTAYDTTCVLDCANNVLTTRYNFVISDTPATGLNEVCRYTPAHNQYIYDENTIHSSVALFDFKANDNGEITSITSHCCSTFVTGDAINFNNSGRALLSSLGMPSNKYIDLTLGTSNSTYIAPANGWLVFKKASTAAKQEMRLTNMSSGDIASFSTSTWDTLQELGTYIPCKKGDRILVYYTAAGALSIFRFVYAEGEQ